MRDNGCHHSPKRAKVSVMKLPILALAAAMACACSVAPDDHGLTSAAVDDSSGDPPPTEFAVCWDVALCYSVENDDCWYWQYVVDGCEVCENQPGPGAPCNDEDLIADCGNLDDLESACQDSCMGIDGANAEDEALAWEYFVCDRISDVSVEECLPLRDDCQGV
jgi:hypothetical protein